MGTGRLVVYCNTSVPPVFSMTTPDMVLGMGVVEAMARVRGRGRAERWEWMREILRGV